MSAEPGEPLSAATCPCHCHLPGYKVTHVDPCCRDFVDPENARSRRYSQPEDVFPTAPRQPNVSALAPLGLAMRKDTPRE